MLLHINSSEFRAILVLLAYLIARTINGWWSTFSSWINLVVEVVVLLALCRWFARGDLLKLRSVGVDDISSPTANCAEVFAVVTGASSGVGLEVAKALALRGMSLIITGRDFKRLEIARAHIKSVLSLNAIHNVRIETAVLDLTNRSNIIEFCASMRSYPIALLVNNAAELLRHRQFVERRGQAATEAMMATNVFGPILLTELLLPTLRETSHLRDGIASRIVNVASCAHTVCWGNVLEQSKAVHVKSDSEGKGTWDYSLCNFVYYYGLSKLCMIWYTAVMWRRFTRDGTASGDFSTTSRGRVVIACCHPGIITTRLYRHLLPEWVLLLLYLPSMLIGKSCAEGAKSVLRACVDDVVVTKASSMVYMLDSGDHGLNSSKPLLSAFAADDVLAHRFCVWAFTQIGLPQRAS
jgi:NAD(P)-dependent dehydrogenase (short-subunit alcohol dehydrogenase family)